jgi:cobalamin biosynthetic protein CobC
MMHGGAVDAAARVFGIASDRWLDLSTGINPAPYPLPPIAADRWHRLPDASLEAHARAAASAYYGAPDPDRVVPVPGTQAAIQWLPRLFAPTTVAIVAPTYAEHRRAWAAAGHAVRLVGGIDAVGDTGVVVLVNPNNPDGRTTAAAAIGDLVDRGATVVVDEAFADTAPDASVARRCERPGLIVLRSFGKFFGLAGLRLGFVITDRDAAKRLAEALGPWAVSGPALAIGAAALADARWIAATRTRLEADARRLDAVLDAAGVPVIGGTTLFRLAEHARAAALFDRLARAGVLVRAFAERPTWLRFGIPAGDAQFDRLAAALAGER